MAVRPHRAGGINQSHRERRRRPRRFQVGSELRTSLRDVLGPQTRPWLLSLDSTIADIEERWGIAVGEMLADGDAACFTCTAKSGAPAVLKLLASPLTAMYEVGALSLWQPEGGVGIIAADPRLGAVLLERAGLPDHSVEWQEAAGLIIRIQQPADPSLRATFPSLAVEAGRRVERARRAFHRQVQTASGELNLITARRLLTRLVATADPGDDVVLHGDLTSNHIVERYGMLAAVDPRPCVGEPAFDVAMWALTADPRHNVGDRVVALAHEVGVEPDRAVSWAWFLAALRAVTTAEEERPIYRDLLRADGIREGAVR